MWCSGCLEIYSDKISLCPRCRQPLTVQPEVALPEPAVMIKATTKQRENDRSASLRVLEFPDRQTTRPAWQQEVKDRVRAYREEHGRAPVTDASATATTGAETAGQSGKTSSGVVSFANRKELDERVVRALQRLETARKNAPDFGWERGPESVASSDMRNASAADTEPLAAAANSLAEVPIPATSGLAHGLRLPVTILEAKEAPVFRPLEAVAPPVRPILTVVGPSETPAQASSPVQAEDAHASEEVVTVAVPPRPRLICVNVIDDDFLERQDMQAERDMSRGLRKMLPVVGKEGDLAPLTLRAVASLVDWGLAFVASWPLLLMAVAGTPNWHWGPLGVLLIAHMMAFMALYGTVITRYAGRTWGQELLFLHVAHVEDGSLPTLRQCALRALAYVLSPVTLGVGLLYALRDAEGRAWHDIASGTIVLRS